MEMLDNIYFMEMTTRWKPNEIARTVEHLRRSALVGVQPSPLRNAIASAIVRFGMFLNGNRYTCPDACSEGFEAR